MRFRSFYEDALVGGVADNKPDKDFNKMSLKIGSIVELEHVSDIDLAKEIAKDHLIEDPDYYKKLIKYIEPFEINNIADKAKISVEKLKKYLDSV